jgi:hypothetical protein
MPVVIWQIASRGNASRRRLQSHELAFPIGRLASLAKAADAPDFDGIRRDTVRAIEQGPAPQQQGVDCGQQDGMSSQVLPASQRRIRDR